MISKDELKKAKQMLKAHPYNPEDAWKRTCLSLIDKEFYASEQQKKRNCRKDLLLKAAHDLLKKQENSGYVLNLLENTIYYDGTECDGSCLMEDIAIELNLEV